MIETKQSIIRSEGIKLKVLDYNNDEVETIALIGRANKQFNNTVSLETHRRGQFLPSVGIQSGYVVVNEIVSENYLVVATYPEIISGEKATDIAHMFVCNSTVSISGVVETADDRGRVTMTPVDKVSGQQVYTQSLTAELRQYEPGLHPDAEHRIFAPYNGAGLLDKVVVTTVRGVEIPLKIVHIDYLSYDGIVVIQVCSETRV